MEYNKLFVEWQIGQHLLPAPSQRSLVVVVDFFLVSNIFFVLSMVSSSCLLFTIFSSSCAWSFLLIVHDFSSSYCSQVISFLSSSHPYSWFFFFFVLSTIFLFLFIWLFIIFSSCSQGLLSPCWQSFILLLLLIVIHDLYFFLFMNVFFLLFMISFFFPPFH